MNRTNWFLAIIAYLLTIATGQFVGGNQPLLIETTFFVLLYGIPIYLVVVFVTEHVFGDWIRSEGGDNH